MLGIISNGFRRFKQGNFGLIKTEKVDQTKFRYKE